MDENETGGNSKQSSKRPQKAHQIITFGPFRQQTDKQGTVLLKEITKKTIGSGTTQYYRHDAQVADPTQLGLDYILRAGCGYIVGVLER